MTSGVVRRARCTVLVTLLVLLFVTTGVQGASASPGIQVGIADDAQILYGNPDKVFLILQQAGTDVVRINLWWGGTAGVAKRRPASPTDPADPAYDWAIFDRAAIFAKRFGMKVMFSVIGTPGWANANRGWNAAPTDVETLRAFAQAASRRYNGRFESSLGKLPAVKLWMVWNEPNNPVFLKPQFRREGDGWVIQSARDYAAMCNATVAGIRAGQGGTKVACGATAPRGNNNPNSSRPSVSPIPFLTGMRAAGARGFDAYAHHPYYGKAQETPSTPPPPGARGNAPTAVTLGNLSVLEKALDQTYGKRMRIWVTEYGYQTNPPDKRIGVSWGQQAVYLTEAYSMLRANPRIDLFIWFLLRDEERLEGWQSGLYTVGWKRKDARESFEQAAMRR